MVRPVEVLALALALDVVFGDLASRWHPVGWMGALYARGRARFALDHAAPTTLLVSGGLVTVSVAGLVAVTAAGIAWVARDLGALGVLVEAVALKQALALRGLVRAGRQVASDLRVLDLEAARAAVGRHLVSRPTGGLD